MRGRARQAAGRHKRKLSRKWRKQRARLKLRHSNAFYLFLGLIMCIGPPLLIGGAGCLGEAAWLQATVGQDRTVYARSVEQWGQLERERFRHAAPAAFLNTSLPGSAVGLLELSELTMEPVASRLEGGEPYLPLRYALSPTLRYNDLRYHSHRTVVSIGLELHASAGPGREVDGNMARAARMRVGAVSPVPLIRERHEHSTSLRCTAGKGIYDFRHNRCTKFEVLRKLCVALHPRPVQATGTAEAPWSLAENAGSAGCEPPGGDRSLPPSLAPVHVLSEADADDEDDENGDGTSTVGGNGWGLGVFRLGPTAGPPAPPPLAGTLYEQVYLGEFLEQTLSGEVAVVVISTAEPGFVASTLPSLAELGSGAVMPTPWLPVRLSFPLMMLGAAMSVPWCVCVSRSREATQLEHENFGIGRELGLHGSASDDEANEMDDLFADLEGGERTGERAPLLGVGLGGQASRHRRWQPPMVQQQAGRLKSSPATAVASDPLVREGAAVRSTRQEHDVTKHPSSSTRISVSGSSSNSGLAGRLESTAFPDVAIGGADFIHFASELGVNLATEPFAHESIVSALRAPLPAPWSAHPTPVDATPAECGSVYYYNADSQQSTYLHPLLQQTRFVITRQRQEHQRRLVGSGVAGERWPALPSSTVAQQDDSAGSSKKNVGDDLGQLTPEIDNVASGGSIAWEARRRQLEIAAESPELGYADPWADPSGDEKDATPRAPLGNDATAGYIDSWAARQQQGQTQSPEEYLSSEGGLAAAVDSSDGTTSMLMPPGSDNLEARLAFLAEPQMSYAANPASTPTPAIRTNLHTAPEMRGDILAPPMARQLEARLASLDSV